MAESRAGLSTPRVVILSQDGTLRAALVGLRPPVLCLALASPYEAAAELLADAPPVLLLDLRLLAPRHLRLLAIAREARVEMLAVGSVPRGLSAEDLSGVRLLARADLKAAVERIVQDRQALDERRSQDRQAALPAGRDEPAAIVASTPQHEVAAPPERAIAGRYVSRGGDRPEPSRSQAAPAKRPIPSPPAAAGTAAPADTQAEAPARKKPAEPPRPQHPPAQTTRSVLTPEELAALMEDES